MKEIAEKYPKVWELVSIDIMGESEKDYQIERYANVKLARHPSWAYYCDDFNALFGYLVLVFFPKHGITIDLDWSDKDDCRFEVWHCGNYCSSSYTPEEVVLRAAEILDEK